GTTRFIGVFVVGLGKHGSEQERCDGLCKTSQDLLHPRNSLIDSVLSWVRRSVELVAQFWGSLLVERKPEMNSMGSFDGWMIWRNVRVKLRCQHGLPIQNSRALKFGQSFLGQVVIDQPGGAQDILRRFGLRRCNRRSVYEGNAEQEGKEALGEHDFS